jgi:hypothetical protein
MLPTYTAGLVQHVLAGSHPDIVSVVPYAAAGVPDNGKWTPTGLRVTLRNGTDVYLSFNRGSSNNGDAADQPTVFQEGDLHGTPVPVS